MENELEGFIDFFKKIPDHRMERKKLYPVEEILVLVFCATIAGCDGWGDIELFGKTKIDMLRNYLPFKNGIPRLCRYFCYRAVGHPSPSTQKLRGNLFNCPEASCAASP